MYRRFCIVLVLIAVSVSTLPVNGRYSLPPYVATCKEAHNASDALIKTLLDYALDPQMDDPIAHCVMGCWLDEPGILKSDGTINPVPLFRGLEARIANVDELTDGFKKCADQQGEGCKKKYMISVCLEREAKRVKYRRHMRQ